MRKDVACMYVLKTKEKGGASKRASEEREGEVAGGVGGTHEASHGLHYLPLADPDTHQPVNLNPEPRIRMQHSSHTHRVCVCVSVPVCVCVFVSVCITPHPSHTHSQAWRTHSHAWLWVWALLRENSWL